METKIPIPAVTIIIPATLQYGVYGAEDFFRLLPTTPRATRYIFDLRKLSFVRPCGVIALLSAIRHCAVVSGHRIILINIDEKLFCYLERMGLFTTAERLVKPIGVPTKQWSKSPTTTNLLELTVIGGYDDVVAIVERARQVFASCLSSNELGPMLSVLSELCSNVFEHSGDSFGCALIQKYRSEQRREAKVCLAVGDAGRGIRASLVRTHGEIRGEPIEYLSAAMSGVTSRTTGRGGTGLRRVREIAAAHNGHVSLRSDTAMIVDRGGGKEDWKRNLAYVAGTQVSVELRSSFEG
jgi:hypothetical protein